MKIRPHSLLSLAALLLSNAAFALVDYAEESSAHAPTQVVRPGNAPRPVSKVEVSAPSSSSSGPSGLFSMGARMESVDVESGGASGKVGFYSLDGHFQTPFDVYLDFNYWMASTSDQSISQKSGNQQGNPEVKLGFNWLSFGNPQDMAAINLQAGSTFKTSNSTLGSSRSDKVFGIETSKRFYDFMLALGYEVRLTGTPDNPDEVAIGNVQLVSAGLGWRATPDIHFTVEAGMYNVNGSDDVARVARLDQKVAFSHVTPKLQLGISPLIDLELGGRFRTKKANENVNLVGARLWNMPGAMGNSIFAGLNMSL